MGWWKTPDERGKAMGVFAEQCVAKIRPREVQDRFAIASTERSLKANTDGSFAWEIAPVAVASKGGEIKIDKRRTAAQGEARQDSGA